MIYSKLSYLYFYNIVYLYIINFKFNLKFLYVTFFPITFYKHMIKIYRDNVNIKYFIKISKRNISNIYNLNSFVFSSIYINIQIFLKS